MKPNAIRVYLFVTNPFLDLEDESPSPPYSVALVSGEVCVSMMARHQKGISSMSS